MKDLCDFVKSTFPGEEKCKEEQPRNGWNRVPAMAVSCIECSFRNQVFEMQHFTKELPIEYSETEENLKYKQVFHRNESMAKGAGGRAQAGKINFRPSAMVKYWR